MSLPAAAAPPEIDGSLPRDVIEKTFELGLQRFHEGDYRGAVEQWTQVLESVPETATNREFREAVVLHISGAWIVAYRHSDNGAAAYGFDLSGGEPLALVRLVKVRHGRLKRFPTENERECGERSGTFVIDQLIRIDRSICR